MDEIELSCPCGAALRTAAENVGATVQCPVCGREQRVVAGAPAGRVEEGSAAVDTAPASDEAARGDAAGPAGTCPLCHEPIRPGARKCPHCQEYLDPKLAKARRKSASVSALAVASFVVALVSPLFLFVPGVVAFMLGALGLVATSKGRAGGRGLAAWGMLLGLVWTCVLILLLAGVVAAIEAGKLPQFGPSPAEPLF